jgi:hypothetical protein
MVRLLNFSSSPTSRISVAPDGSPRNTVVRSPDTSPWPQATNRWNRGKVICRERILLNHSGRKRSCACMSPSQVTLAWMSNFQIRNIFPAFHTPRPDDLPWVQIRKSDDLRNPCTKSLLLQALLAQPFAVQIIPTPPASDNPQARG